MVRAARFNAPPPFLASRCQSLLQLAPPASWSLTTCHPNPLRGSASSRLSHITPRTSTGLLTRCPSPAPRGCGLGPTNPTRTDLPSETLDFRRTWFSHVSRYSCRHSHSQTLQSTFQLAFAASGTLPYQYTPKRVILSFGAVLEPRYIIRATAFD